MNNIERIKAEIEQRMDNLYPQLPDAAKVVHENISLKQANTLGKYVALESLANFIDSLPEESKEDIVKVGGPTNMRKKEQFIGKVCEWLENHNDYLRICNNGSSVRWDMTRCIYDLRKSINEQL